MNATDVIALDDHGTLTTDDRLDPEGMACPVCGESFAPVVETCPDDGSRLIAWRASNDPLVGAVLDSRFRLVERIGAGSMGLVYRGVQLSVGREVAIKYEIAS